MKNELKPCPFCGSDKVQVFGHYEDETKISIFVGCWQCGCRTGTASIDLKDKLIKVWNRRENENTQSNS